MDECYQGEYQSKKEFAESISEDLFTIPENLIPYIDYEAIAWDLFVSGDYFSIELDYKVHVFSNC
jgi:antirestriction protein